MSFSVIYSANGKIFCCYRKHKSLFKEFNFSLFFVWKLIFYIYSYTLCYEFTIIFMVRSYTCLNCFFYLQSVFEICGSLIGRLIARCSDPDLQVRLLGVDCIQRTLNITVSHVGKTNLILFSCNNKIVWAISTCVFLLFCIISKVFFRGTFIYVYICIYVYKFLSEFLDNLEEMYPYYS